MGVVLNNALDVLQLVSEKFTSGNEIPVERITLTRKEVEKFLETLV